MIAQLAKRLECRRTLSGSPANGLMFPGQAGKPIDLDALAAEVILPAFTKAGIRWQGWHAFRRGRATNLHRLGVSDSKRRVLAVLTGAIPSESRSAEFLRRVLTQCQQGDSFSHQRPQAAADRLGLSECSY